jgi:hypothetical protein
MACTTEEEMLWISLNVSMFYSKYKFILEQNIAFSGFCNTFQVPSFRN